MNHFLKTEKTARVVIEGTDNPDLKDIWFIIHGYGYLAPYFIRKFSSLFSKQNLIIVPEALNRFYLNGVTEKVGASWMTKEERENDIQDNNVYLSKVYENFVTSIKQKANVNVLGFSQGAAAACRWAVSKNYRIDNLIIWGSNIPPDFNREILDERKANFNWHYVAGDKDEFISVDKQKEQVKILQDLGIRPTTLFYEGSHDINEKALYLLTQNCVKKP